MARRAPAFLDANILMYAIGKEHPYKQPCIAVLKQIEAEAIHVVTSVEVLQEILHRYYSLRSPEVATTAFTNMKRLCERVFPVFEADVDRAHRMLQDLPHLNVRDAIHAASALAAAESKIVSEDRVFDRVPGMTRTWPPPP